MAFGRVATGGARLVPNRDLAFERGARDCFQRRGRTRDPSRVPSASRRRPRVARCRSSREAPRRPARRGWDAPHPPRPPAPWRLAGLGRISTSRAVRHRSFLVTPDEKTEMRGTRVRARGAMGRGGHSDDEGTPYDQRLEEVEFMRSACVAAQRGDVDKLRAMLHRRPDVCTNDGVGGDSGYTPLHYAAREGHAECVRALLASGANANARTRAGAPRRCIARGVHRGGRVRPAVAGGRGGPVRAGRRRGERAAQGERERSRRRGEGAASRGWDAGDSGGAG